MCVRERQREREKLVSISVSTTKCLRQLTYKEKRLMQYLAQFWRIEVQSACSGEVPSMDGVQVEEVSHGKPGSREAGLKLTHF